MKRKNGELNLDYDRGKSFYTYCPNSLQSAGEIKLDGETISLLIKAHNLLGRLDGIFQYLPNSKLIRQLLVKQEAFFSLCLDYDDMRNFDIFDNNDSQSKCKITAYINALEVGQKSLRKTPMSLDFIKSLHKELTMNHCSDSAGNFRDQQIFTNPNVFTNIVTYNPPNIQDMEKSLEELEKYFSTNYSYDKLIKAALIYYQFETIYPFSEANRSTNSLFTSLYFIKEELLPESVLCLSYYFYINNAEFKSVLNSVRNYSHYTIWINFFLKSLIIAAENAIRMIDSLHKLREIDYGKIKNVVKEASATLLVYEFIWTQPKIEIKDLVIALGLSYNTVAKVVRTLEKLDILFESSRKQRYRRYYFRQFLENSLFSHS